MVIDLTSSGLMPGTQNGLLLIHLDNKTSLLRNLIAANRTATLLTTY